MDKQLLSKMQQRMAEKRAEAERARAGIRLDYLPADLEHREWQRIVAHDRVLF